MASIHLHESVLVKKTEEKVVSQLQQSDLTIAKQVAFKKSHLCMDKNFSHI